LSKKQPNRDSFIHSAKSKFLKLIMESNLKKSQSSNF